MKQKSKLLCLLGALAILISLLAPTEGSTAGKPSVTIHNIIDLTGAYAPIAIPSEKGGTIIWHGLRSKADWMFLAMGRLGSRLNMCGLNLEMLMLGSCLPTRGSGFKSRNQRSLRCGPPRTRR